MARTKTWCAPGELFEKPTDHRQLGLKLYHRCELGRIDVHGVVHELAKCGGERRVRVAIEALAIAECVEVEQPARQELRDGTAVQGGCGASCGCDGLHCLLHRSQCRDSLLLSRVSDNTMRIE